MVTLYISLFWLTDWKSMVITYISVKNVSLSISEYLLCHWTFVVVHATLAGVRTLRVDCRCLSVWDCLHQQLVHILSAQTHCRHARQPHSSCTICTNTRNLALTAGCTSTLYNRQECNSCLIYGLPRTELIPSAMWVTPVSSTASLGLNSYHLPCG